MGSPGQEDNGNNSLGRREWVCGLGFLLGPLVVGGRCHNMGEEVSHREGYKCKWFGMQPRLLKDQWTWDGYRGIIRSNSDKLVFIHCSTNSLGFCCNPWWDLGCSSQAGRLAWGHKRSSGKLTDDVEGQVLGLEWGLGGERKAMTGEGSSSAAQVE